ncbi:hypothetical protein [Aggregatilinea lenta]|uniref:hypothetical protein n=1 Tax=Aggregatilinea lenta TaxID=913108 RepID=UPI000E5B38BD|nr:hypothetical protein [Aggregatilinea lenta]
MAVAITVVVIAALPVMSSAVRAAQPEAEIVPRFGIVARAGADPAQIEALGVGWVLVPVEWRAFQPDGPDEFDTDALDPDWVTQIREGGREVVVQITDTPEWASMSGRGSAVPDGLSLPATDDANVWAGFARRLAETYAPLGIHRWTLYDAPNVRRGEGRTAFEGDTPDYARLVTVAAEVMRAADPDARLQLAAPDAWVDAAAGRTPFLARLLPEFGADGPPPFDAVTIRARSNTAQIAAQVMQTRALLDGAGLVSIPIWLEAGAAATLDRDDDPQPTLGITPQMQADFVVQAAALAVGLNVERLAVQQLADASGGAPWGLLRDDGSARPAYAAYRAAIDLFADAGAATHFANRAAEVVTFGAPEPRLIVFWAMGETPVDLVVTSPEVGESAALLDLSTGEDQSLVSEPFSWPAAFTVSASAAARDAHGFLTVAGSPRLLRLDVTDFYRVVYLRVDGAYRRLK